MVLAGGAGLAARSAGAGPRAQGRPFRDGVPDAVEQAGRRRSRLPDDDFISAKGKRVVIIGGGDTGADCLGTVHRQGALSVHQFELLPRPPDTRARRQSLAAVAERLPRLDRARRGRRARVLGVDPAFHRRRSGAREEAARLEGRARPQRREDVVRERRPAASSRWTSISCCWRWAFWAPSGRACSTNFGVKLTERGNVWRDANWMTSVPGVFAAGDMQRGQSLIVWAIAEGRSAARGVDLFLMGKSDLPAPLA